MDKLIEQLKRLYLPADTPFLPLADLDRLGVRLATADGRVRALSLPFPKLKQDRDDQHWQRLCSVANGLQAELGLPAPAVSIDGAEGYRLWLSFDSPVPAADARAFVALLWARYCPDVAVPVGGSDVDAPVDLPPGLHPGTGKWAAFIHPGMGASFADDPGLEMAPPMAGQVAFLEGLDSIVAAELQQALERLAPPAVVVTQAPAVAARPAATAAAAHFPGNLLLKDATLEDIVRFLHAKHIEPTFRHVLPPGEKA